MEKIVSNLNIIVPLAIFAVEITLIKIFSKMRDDTLELKAKGSQTEAIIEKIVINKGKAVSYSFTDYSGKAYTGLTTVPTGAEYAVGEKANVQYNISKPAQSCLTNEIDYKVKTLGFLIKILRPVAFIMPVIFFFILTYIAPISK